MEDLSGHFQYYSAYDLFSNQRQLLSYTSVFAFSCAVYRFWCPQFSMFCLTFGPVLCRAFGAERTWHPSGSLCSFWSVRRLHHCGYRPASGSHHVCWWCEECHTQTCEFDFFCLNVGNEHILNDWVNTVITLWVIVSYNYRCVAKHPEKSCKNLKFLHVPVPKQKHTFIEKREKKGYIWLWWMVTWRQHGL